MTKQLEFEPETALTIPAQAAIEAQYPPLVINGSPLMQIIARAVDRGADINTVKELRELLRETEADDARKAFNVAFAGFKKEAIHIVKNVKITSGPLAGKSHANLQGVVEVVTPALAKYGLSASWKVTKDSLDWLEVTCVIRHNLGHSEQVSLGAAPDTGPGRNAIQARGSAISYLERYSLLAITGLSTTDQDDDGVNTGAKQGSMDEKSFATHLENIENASNIETLKTAYVAAIKAAEAANDKTASKQFEKAKDTRKKGLGE